MAEAVNNIIHAKAPKRVDFRVSYVVRADTAVLEHQLGNEVRTPISPWALAILASVRPLTIEAWGPVFVRNMSRPSSTRRLRKCCAMRASATRRARPTLSASGRRLIRQNARWRGRPDGSATAVQRHPIHTGTLTSALSRRPERPRPSVPFSVIYASRGMCSWCTAIGTKRAVQFSRDRRPYEHTFCHFFLFLLCICRGCRNKTWSGCPILRLVVLALAGLARVPSWRAA